MIERYKVAGIDPGAAGLQLGNCLTMRKLRAAVNTPTMYAKVRGSVMSSMARAGTLLDLVFLDELFASRVVLDHVVPEHPQRGDTSEGALLVAALLIAFPNARFGLGLPGAEKSLRLTGHYRSLGKKSLDLRDGSKAPELVTRLFDYLRMNSYWVDDDLVHLLALLTDFCQDRDRTIPAQVLSLSTSGNHQVDAGLFHAYQLIEALLEIRDHEPLRDSVARWNDTYPLQLDADEIDFIRNLRDLSLHFKAERAAKRLRQSRIALGFDEDSSRQSEFRRYGMQRLLREIAQAYFLARL